MASHLPLVTLIRVLDAVAPPLAARVLARLFVRPRRLPAPEWERRIAESARPLRLASGHRGLCWGEGPPVLLAHGWESRVTQLGSFVAPLVARGFRVLGFYAPAHGPHEERTLTALDYASFLHAAARETGPLHAVIGHSMGAAAAGFALHMGLQAGRVVLVCTPESVDTAARYFESALGFGPATRRQFRERLARDVFDAPIEHLAVSRHARDFRVPALLLSTADDRQVPPDDTRRLGSAWPGAVTRVFADAGGHRRILRDPRAIEAAVDFICGPAVHRAPGPAERGTLAA